MLEEHLPVFIRRVQVSPLSTEESQGNNNTMLVRCVAVLRPVYS